MSIRTACTGRRAIVGTGLLLAALSAAAPALADDGWTRLPATPRLGYETVQFDDGTKMGLVGTTYLVQAAPGLCLGPAVYGSASGPYGGLFTVGAEGALCTALAGPLRLVAGLYVGGGGGGTAPVGGGLMLRPHADLLWDFGPWRAGLSLSYVSFPGGALGSTQLGLVFEADTSFSTLRGGASATTDTGTPPGGIGFDRVVAVGGAYRPRGVTLGESGAPLAATIGLVGARAEALLAPHLYGGIEANAAASGGAAGYAELLGTLGVAWPLDAAGALTLGGRVALGMGGGGDVPVGGGLLAKAALDGRWRILPELALGLEAGWAVAPQGDFSAPYGTLSLQWLLEPTPGAPAQAVRQEWSAGVEQVFDAARKAGPPQSLQQLSFKYTRFVGEVLYLNGQVQSAFAGDAGAFSVGLFGIGGIWQPTPALQLGAEFALGAAGGGGVDTGGGLVVKPMLYAGLGLTPHWSLRAGGGWLKAVDGPLSSAVAELSLVYRFDVAGAR